MHIKHQRGLTNPSHLRGPLRMRHVAASWPCLERAGDVDFFYVVAHMLWFPVFDGFSLAQQVFSPPVMA